MGQIFFLIVIAVIFVKIRKAMKTADEAGKRRLSRGRPGLPVKIPPPLNEVPPFEAPQNKSGKRRQEESVPELYSRVPQSAEEQQQEILPAMAASPAGTIGKNRLIVPAGGFKGLPVNRVRRVEALRQAVILHEAIGKPRAYDI